jgi:lipoprotein NlpD
MHQTLLSPPRRRALTALAVAALAAACTTTPLPRQPPMAYPPGATPVPAPPPAAAPAPAPKATFIWPAEGATVGRFDGNRNKGIDIAGRLGDPVLAAADGRVVIVSNELRGYGTMVIVRHNDTFITAYAHIDRALVRENEIVRQGQKIAEMGQSGTDRVKLHFEIRRQGTAIDPEPYLQGKLR